MWGVRVSFFRVVYSEYTFVFGIHFCTPSTLKLVNENYLASLDILTVTDTYL